MAASIVVLAECMGVTTIEVSGVHNDVLNVPINLRPHPPSPSHNMHASARVIT